MNVSNTTAVVSSAVGLVGLVLAVIQYLDGKRQRRTQEERLAQQQELLNTAVMGTTAGFRTADLIVQRAKAEDVTVEELQNLARSLRGNLKFLGQLLEGQRSHVAALRSSGNPYFSRGGSSRPVADKASDRRAA